MLFNLDYQRAVVRMNEARRRDMRLAYALAGIIVGAGLCVLSVALAIHVY